MTELSRKIIAQHLVRKTANQKKAFRDMLVSELAGKGIEAHEEKHKDLFRSVNLIIGDVEKAEMIFGAHYDTCSRMPFPNFITPKNPLVYYAYQIAIVFALLLISTIPAIPVAMNTTGREAYLVWYFTYLALFVLMMKGPANPTTLNDNTSGVVTLIELMTAMPENLRSRCAFVFFDNEEMGLQGSRAFKGTHKQPAKETPMVNLDCVGDGEYFLLAASKAFRADDELMSAVKAAFGEGEKQLYSEAEKTVYPSDQKKFEKSLAIAALHKGPKVGYYMNRIHTPKDTILNEENVLRISAGLSEMAERFLK